jgi:hypothetical protein
VTAVPLAGLLVAMIVGAAPDPAAARFATGLADPGFTSADRDGYLEQARASGARFARINLSWAQVATRAPDDAADPGDPAYDFAVIDAAVAAASAEELEPVLTVSGAPPFAEAPGRPSSAPAGTWRPDPGAYGAFARAVARRYSGSFERLPRVRYYQAWNEPNLSTYLTPQYEGKRSRAPGIYRQLLNSFYAGVNAVDRRNVVITGGTAPYGDPRGGSRTRPLAFWRGVLCLKDRRHLRRAKCPAKADFDVLAHHPINTSGGPTRSAIDPDDASTADFGELRRILRAAKRRHTLGTRGHHPLWATEIWWSTRPPDPHGVKPRKQARYLEQALYLLWRQGAKVVINLQVRDPRYDRSNKLQVYAGLFKPGGRAKPALTAFRFPFVTHGGGSRLHAWGIAPEAGRLTIERKRGGRWRAVKRLHVRNGKVFQTRIRVKGRERLRATVAGRHSLIWRSK